MTYDEKSTHLREDATAGKPSFKILDTESGASAFAKRASADKQARAVQTLARELVSCGAAGWAGKAVVFARSREANTA